MTKLHDKYSENHIFSDKELTAAIMENNGVLCTLPGGYACNGVVPNPHKGWVFLWVNTQGTGNNGSLVMAPTTEATRQTAKEGRIRWIQRSHGCSRELAERYVTAARGVRYSHESGVVHFVLEYRDHPAWQSFNPASVRRWMDNWGVETDLSVPRVLAAREVILAMG